MSAIVTRVGTLVKGFFSRFLKDGLGLTAREYSLIASLILIGALGPFTPVGVKLSAIFS
jgi:Flp pilus assembly pilin Flp